MTPEHLEVKAEPAVVLESQGIWALPEFHRKSKHLKLKHNSTNQALI